MIDALSLSTQKPQNVNTCDNNLNTISTVMQPGNEYHFNLRAERKTQ